LAYQLLAFATEMLNTEHILEIKSVKIKNLHSVQIKQKSCERPNEV